MALRTAIDHWARALTDERLASELARMAESIRLHTAEERKVLLVEAAKRLDAVAGGPRI